MTISALWPDGTLITAASWDELEADVIARQWHPFTVTEFRAEMRRRAELWTGDPTVSVPDETAEDVFRALERLDMVRLDTEGGVPDAAG